MMGHHPSHKTATTSIMVVLHHGWIGCGYAKGMEQDERHVDREERDCSYNNISQLLPNEENRIINNKIKKNQMSMITFPTRNC
jgi:hypothetical protein